MKKRKYILCIYALIILLTVSCTKNYDLRNEKSAADQIIEDLKTKKIVFIGENHNDVYPILFLTKHLEEFYEEGLRYLFLETGDDGVLQDSNIHEYDYSIVPQWGLYAWKYEQQLLEFEIEKINSLYEDDPIKVIWPEYKLIIPSDLEATEVLNYRDQHIQEKIISTMNNSKTNEKAIIFYGSGHGAKQISKYKFSENPNIEWKMTGWYLSNHYQNDYVAYHFNYLPFKNISNIKSESVILSNKNLSTFIPKEFLNLYDYECISPVRIYGIIYPYYNSNKNIEVLSKKAKQFIEGNADNLSKWDNMEGLLAVYYLKYQLGNNFIFSYEGQSQFEIKDDKPNIELRNLQELEQYAEKLYSYGWLEDYLFSPCNDKRIGYILHNMKKAKKIDSYDIWPQYWISYFETEKAKYSGKKRDYKKALAEWNKLLENDLLYASPVLKLTYRKIAMCEEKLGNTEKSQYYKQKESEVNMLYEIDYEKYVYFGY